MKRSLWLLGVAAVALAGRGARAHAQRGMGQAPRYDTATVQTIAGTIVRIDTIAGARSAGGIHLQLRTEGETLPVHLGPSWFRAQQAFGLAVGDRITVRGSRITYAGAPALIAAEVTRDGKVLKVRDARGFPAWSGSGGPPKR